MMLKYKESNGAWVIVDGFDKIRWSNVSLVREGDDFVAFSGDQRLGFPDSLHYTFSDIYNNDYSEYPCIWVDAENDQSSTTFCITNGYILNDNGKTIEVLN